MPKDFKVKIKKMLEGTGPLMQSKFVPEWKKLYPDTPFDVTVWGFERLTGTCTHTHANPSGLDHRCKQEMSRQAG